MTADTPTRAQDREFGFYWVCIEGEWLVAEYQDNDSEVWCWCLPGEMSLVEEFRLSKIDERRLEPPVDPVGEEPL